MVIDAPCSGSGLFRRDPEAIGEWSETNVQICHQRQQRILADAWPALKQDGLLIYSTCSYSQEENEDILDWMMENLQTSSHRLQKEQHWNIVETISPLRGAYGYRFFPDKVKGEGFFIACMQKKDGGLFSYPGGKKTVLEKLSKHEEAMAKPYLKEDAALSYFKHNDQAYAFPRTLFNDLAYLRNTLYLKKAGISLGKSSPKELIPDHELALSTIINREIPIVPVNIEEAIHYLRKEEIKPDISFKGWALVQYQQQSLGWIKILDNRVNNYYPKAWRIRTAPGALRTK
jgi:NOL1/NOP2/fmu family ribosome biogenesis protein